MSDMLQLVVARQLKTLLASESASLKLPRHIEQRVDKLVVGLKNILLTDGERTGRLAKRLLPILLPR